MPPRSRNVLQTFPPRALGPSEHDILAEWLHLADDIPSAYVSERRTDDPHLYRRIVIGTGPNGRPTHYIHAPTGLSCWLRMCAGSNPNVQEFPSLRAALNSIREVLR